MIVSVSFVVSIPSIVGGLVEARCEGLPNSIAKVVVFFACPFDWSCHQQSANANAVFREVVAMDGGDVDDLSAASLGFLDQVHYCVGHFFRDKEAMDSAWSKID